MACMLVSYRPLGEILELRRPRSVLPHVARAPARLDLRVLDLAVYFFRLYKYFHEGVTGAVDLCANRAGVASMAWRSRH